MGSASTVECCQSQPSSQELVSILPSRIRAIAVVEESYQAIRQAVCATAFLSEIDYYIIKLREDEAYRAHLLRLFPSSEHLLDTVAYQLTPQWVTPIQSKTYDLALLRLHPFATAAAPLEFGLIHPNAGNADALFSRGNLRKTCLLMLDRDLRAYKEEEFLQLMVASLKEWKGLEDFVWVLDPQTTFADMRRHLLYHWGRCVGFINSDLSLNDALSWARARFLYHFALHVLANEPLPLLEDAYSLDNWVYEAEGALLAPGLILTFFGFAQLAPFVEERSDYEDDAVRFNPPKGEEEVPHLPLKLVVAPLKETANKFRCNETLFYLPLTTFLVEKMEHKYGKIFVYLKEQSSQDLTKYLCGKTRGEGAKSKASGEGERRMMSELSAYRDSTAKEMEMEGEGGSECCVDYYRKYVRGRVARLAEEEVPVLSKKELEICEEEVKVLDEEPTLEEVESEPRWVPVTPKEAAALERDLGRYIKRLQFEKLQSQIDNADRFINITSLNISQCWLERLECLHCFPNLLELFAYSNLIRKVDGLQRNENLRLLSLARNEIELLENIGHLTHLRELYLTKNRLELASAVYLSGLGLAKLKLLTISFKQQADECFDALLHRPPPRLKQLVINEGDLLAHRTKNTLRRRLKGVDIQYIHN